MNKRTVIAYFTVDEDRAFDEFGDGPAAYFIHEAGWLEQSGIFSQMFPSQMQMLLIRKRHIWYTSPDLPLIILATERYIRCDIRTGAGASDNI